MIFFYYRKGKCNYYKELGKELSAQLKVSSNSQSFLLSLTNAEIMDMILTQHGAQLRLYRVHSNFLRALIRVSN